MANLYLCVCENLILSFSFLSYTIQQSIFDLHFNNGELPWLVSSFVSLIFCFLLWFRILVYSLILDGVFCVLLFFLLTFFSPVLKVFFLCYNVALGAPQPQSLAAQHDLRISQIQSPSQYEVDPVSLVSAPFCNLEQLAARKGEGAEFFQSSLPGK